MTGSAHDATAFRHTAAARFPDWIFQGQEFAWTDSAYGVSSRTIPVFKEPASQEENNARFNKVVAHLRVRSEHCMGALKSRWQCLRGLRVRIHDRDSHMDACRWMTVCIILHNLVVEVEGIDTELEALDIHGQDEEAEDNAAVDRQADQIDNDNANDEVANQRRRELVNELTAFAEMRHDGTWNWEQ